jgi:hypothetical protein
VYDATLLAKLLALKEHMGDQAAATLLIHISPIAWPV